MRFLSLVLSLSLLLQGVAYASAVPMPCAHGSDMASMPHHSVDVASATAHMPMEGLNDSCQFDSGCHLSVGILCTVQVPYSDWLGADMIGFAEPSPRSADPVEFWHPPRAV